MWKKLQHDVIVVRVSKSTVNDEIVLSYPGPEIAMKLSIQPNNESMLDPQIYGRDATSMLKVFLEHGQELDADDRVIYDGQIYTVVSVPDDYHRHKTVILKWQSSLT